MSAFTRRPVFPILLVTLVVGVPAVLIGAASWEALVTGIVLALALDWTHEDGRRRERRRLGGPRP